MVTQGYSRWDDKERSQRKEEGRHEQGMAERAPSTAEEFQRVAEEKTRQGFASQTVEKAEDVSQGAAMPDSTSASVKEGFKAPPNAGN